MPSRFVSLAAVDPAVAGASGAFVPGFSTNLSGGGVAPELDWAGAAEGVIMADASANKAIAAPFFMAFSQQNLRRVRERDA